MILPQVPWPQFTNQNSKTEHARQDILKLNTKSKAKIQIVNIMKLLNSSFFLTTLGTYDMINLMGASHPRQGRPNFVQIWLNIKGQIISKRLFGILGFFQKTNKQIRFYYCQAKKNEFVRSFFGRIRGYQKSFRNYLTFNNLHHLGGQK